MKPIFKIQKPTNQPKQRKTIQDSDDEDERKHFVNFNFSNLSNKDKFMDFLRKKKFSNVFDFDDNQHYIFKNFKFPKYTFPSIYPKLRKLQDLNQNQLLPIHKNTCFFNLMRHFKLMQCFNYNKTCSYITLFPLLLDFNMLIYFINSYNQENCKDLFKRFDVLLDNFKSNCKKLLSKELYDEINVHLSVREMREAPWGERFKVYEGLSCITIRDILNELGLDFGVWEINGKDPSVFTYHQYSDHGYPIYIADSRMGHIEINLRYDMPFFMDYTREYDCIPEKLKKYVDNPNEAPIEHQPIVNEYIIKEKKRKRNEILTSETNDNINSYYEMMKLEGRLDDLDVQYILGKKRQNDWDEYGQYGININEELSMERRFNNRPQNRNKRNPVRPILRRVRRRLRRNNNKMKRNFRKKIKNINEKLFEIDKKLGDKSVIYTKPSNLRLSSAQNLLKTYGKGVYNYLLSLIKPELSVSGRFIAKQPAFINIPTSNVCFKEQINIKLDSMNNFYMFWVPNFLSTEYSLQNHLADISNYDKTYRYYSHLYYTDGASSLTNWFLHTSYLPKINLSKYRLVSSKCVMQYNGTIMNQQGQFHSCALYNDLPVFIGRGVTQREEVQMSKTNLSSLMGDDFNLSDFCDIELVRNGLWNKYINITTNSRSLENVALPTDPTDHTFFPMSHYYAKEPPKITEGESSSIDQMLSYAKSSDGGHLSYLYTCQNMSSENGYITVIIYYNFEIIPDQSTAPFLRSKKTEEESKIYNIVKNSGVIEKLQEIVANKPKIDMSKESLFNLVKQAIIEGSN